MIRNYFKTAWKYFRKSKLHSFINIGGLSAGMAVAILIGLWIYDEISFNKNFANYDRIAQVYQNLNNNDELQTWTTMPFPLADELRNNYGSYFSQVVLAANMGEHLISVNQKKVKSTGAYFEKGMPEMFTLHMQKGDWNCLHEEASVILSASAAKAYFGDADPMDKIIKIDDNPVVKVTGVYEDFPRNCSFAGLDFISTWDFLYRNSGWMGSSDDPWRPNFTTLFVRLNKNADINKVSAVIKDAKLKRISPLLQTKKPELFLQPMRKWHLYSEFKNGVNTGGAIQYVWIFCIIGLSVLLLACINFMNLSTARSEKRAREVGIRKTMGSSRLQLITQFLAESFVTVLFAFVLSLLIVHLTLPFFNQVADKQLDILWRSSYFWLLAAGFTLLTSFVAGSYPAFYLSSFNPVKVIKGPFKAGRFAAIPRKILVVLQFTVSVTLIIGTIIIYRQIGFARNRPVGYTRSGLISVPLNSASFHDHLNAVKEELLKSGAVQSAAESGSPTTGIWGSTSGFSWSGKDPGQSIDFGNVNASYDYGKTIGWTIKEGRDFSSQFPSDTSALILNEAAARFMKMEKPVGQTMTWWGQPYTVIGVVNNMVMESPYDDPRPVIYSATPEPGSIMLIRLNPSAATSASLARIETVFRKFNPDQPFEYHFVDEEYAKKFGNEERIGKLAGFFTILAVFISCLGLFGLTSFVAEQRQKEMSVRKVLGASFIHIWNLLSIDFVRLVLLSFLIAVPLSYYFMHNWLKHYAYRTEMSWWIFAAAGAGSLLITLLVVSMQSVSSALVNPVKSLKSD